MKWMVIQNKLQPLALRDFSHVELKVNDMHIIGNRAGGMWNIKIFHEEKDTRKTERYSTSKFIEYLNAYITTARTKIELLRE